MGLQISLGVCLSRHTSLMRVPTEKSVEHRDYSNSLDPPLPPDAVLGVLGAGSTTIRVLRRPRALVTISNTLHLNVLSFSALPLALSDIDSQP